MLLTIQDTKEALMTTKSWYRETTGNVFHPTVEEIVRMTNNHDKLLLE